MLKNEAGVRDDGVDLEKQRLQLERERLEFERKKREEAFVVRNFGSISAGAISVIAVLVSLGQVYIAWQQRRIAEAQVSIASHQDQLAEAQTVQRFIPHLVGQDSEKELALIAMDSFVNRNLVTRLATKLPSQGSEAALQTLSTEGGDKEKKLAQSALNELGSRRKQLVEQMFAEDKTTRIAATSQIVREWKTDPTLIQLILDRANLEQSKGVGRNNAGIINSIFVLQNMDASLLKQYKAEIMTFLEAARDNGPQTADLVSNLSAQLTKDD